MAASFIFLIFCFAIIDVVSSKDYLIHGTPSDSRGITGLYGGYYEFGKKLDMKLTHITRASYGTSSMDGVVFTSISYDPISKDVLFLGSNNLQYFLGKLDPCINEEIEEKNMYFSPRNVLFAGPFALYDSEIYYVAREYRPMNKVSIWMSLTIRKVTGCQNDDQTFMDRRGYGRPNCSVEVAKILDKEIFREKNDEYPLIPRQVERIAGYIRPVGSTLLVTKKDDKLYFFVQIADPLNPRQRKLTTFIYFVLIVSYSLSKTSLD